MELFGKLHTTAVPAVIISDLVPSASVSVPFIPDIMPGHDISSSTITSSFVGDHTIRFGSGRVVDSDAKDITEDLYIGGGVLHSISPNVGDYHARAFVEEAVRLYDPSPHSGSVVFLDRVSDIKRSSPDREYFVLLVSNILTEPVAITGWKVLDRQTKILYTFPKGVKVLGSVDIGYLSLPIVVQSGDVIVVSSGKSPIGHSFRVNKCSGYRSQFEKFIPTIKTPCPNPLQEFLDDGTVPFFDDKCYETVTSLPVCTVVDTIHPKITGECRNFLKNVMTETGCVSKHKNDPDFLTPEWRVFLNSDRELWKNKDNVLYLLDKNNLLVATLVYQ